MVDTIAAYSGGTLPAAIGIVRLSGPQAHSILDRLFTTKRGKMISKCNINMIYYGTLSDVGGNAVDICTAVLYRAPRSYTGEDMAEIFCHGSAAIVSAALSHAFELGARPAKAGEFTMRAFLNGKLDLTEAEAVADLIYSPSALAAQTAVRQLIGGVGGKIKLLREQIIALLAHFYAVCDYTDEEIDPFEYQNAAQVFTAGALELDRLCASFERGKFVREGIPVAITGRPNAGKSSLFNALCGYDRAIVTDEAGTTRDVLDTVVTCGDTAIRLLDTAGIREAAGKAEQIGVEKALEAIANTQSVLCLTDCSRHATADDARILRLALEASSCALVLSKLDCVDSDEIDLRLDELRGLGFERELGGVGSRSLPTPDEPGRPAVFAVSARDGAGLPALCDWLSALSPTPAKGEVIITSARQAALAASAARDLRSAAESAGRGMTADAFLSDAERSANTLGQITGETASPDIAAEIFSRFCVGK